MTQFIGEFQYFDFFAGKPMELILMMVFMLAFIIFWKFVTPREENLLAFRSPEAVSWFALRDGIYYHKGHTWAAPQGDLLKVGLDDFAQKLVGKCERLFVPKVGEKVEQGDVGFKLAVDSTVIDVLSPVKGEVVAVNENVVKNPELINTDPYGEGWVMLVKPHSLKTNLRNLLTGALAKTWFEHHVESLREKMTTNLGLVYQDGGVLVSGIAKAMDPENWEGLVKEFLLPE